MKKVNAVRPKNENNFLRLLLSLKLAEYKIAAESFSEIVFFLVQYSFLFEDTEKVLNSCGTEQSQLYALQENRGLGARYLDPRYSMWLSTDPALSYYVEGKSNGYSGGIFNSINLNLYHYAGNNPIKYTDPDGKDWLCRNVDGVEEVFYREDITTDSQAQRAYGDSSYVLTDGQQYNGYTFYNSNGNPYMTDSSGKKVNQIKPIQGDNFDIFPGSATKQGVNPDTLHQNLFGTSYTGPNNPKDYQNNPDFSYNPRNRSEYGSIAHDKAYGVIGAVGIKGALFNRDVLGADFDLVRYNVNNVFTKETIGTKDRLRSVVTAFAFGMLQSLKFMFIPSESKTMTSMERYYEHH